MPVCTNCHNSSPEGYRFCGHCGAALLVATCPSCGAPNPAEQPFCGQCGLSLRGEAGTVTPLAIDERKLATVLFADVVGFTSLAERTDHELVARMVDTAFRRLAEVVVEHGGTVDKYMGDSVMAVFGVPVAHDDDAERAVAAALAIRQVTGELAFSIGINSGELTATTVAGGNEATVIGDVVNIAARLEKVAGPGEVLCGRLTAELAGGRVEFRDREPVLLKGKAQPVEVCEAVAIRSFGVAPAGADTPLIGRDDELTFLRAQWRRVRRDRRPLFVLLCGDAGSGKTRLVTELAHLATTGGTVVWATYPAYGPMGGARVASEILRQLGPVDDGDVEARVRSLAGEVDPSLQAIDPAAMKQEQSWALGRFLHEKGSESPLLVVIDDMHRSGERTLELLADLTGRVGDVPLLTVLAGRTDPGDWLTRFPSATTIRLSPLNRLNATDLASAFAADKPLSAEAAEFFVDKAGGNPLYMRELVAMARSQGALVDEGDSYGLIAHAAIPASLHALLAARLDALDPRRKLVLQYVSLLGEAVDADQVESLGCADAASVLRSLVDDGLVSQGGDGRFEVVDSLLREVAYETLPRHLRGELHRQAAGLVPLTEERARHLDHAADYLADDEIATVEAAQALATAGEELIEASRHLDALVLLERAVALGYVGSSGLLALAKIQSLTGRHVDALETLAKIADDPDDPSLAAERDHTAANTMTFADPAWAVPRLAEAAERWNALGETSKEAWARANTGVALFNQSRMVESAGELRSALALFEEAGDRWGLVNTTSFLALVTPTDHRVPDWLADALQFADAAGDKSRQLSSLTALSWHNFFRSFCGSAEEMAEAERFAFRHAQLAEELGTDDVAMHSWSLLALMARFTGRLDEARRRIMGLQRVLGKLKHEDAWLAAAASFAVTLASGEVSAAPPDTPRDATEPVTGVARLVVATALTLAGRGDEVLAGLGEEPRHELGPFGEMAAGILDGLTLQLAGRSSEAERWVAKARPAAVALHAQPAIIAAAALSAEISGDVSGLPPPVPAASISGLLVLRAHAAAGDGDALDVLRSCSERLAMPALAGGF